MRRRCPHFPLDLPRPAVPYGSEALGSIPGQAPPQRRKKQTRLIQSHLAVFLARSLKARTMPPVSDGEMVFSSTKITPPCFRSSSPAGFKQRGNRPSIVGNERQPLRGRLLQAGGVLLS